jgi:AbrB family looped-hinge helix DNA binding protein
VSVARVYKKGQVTIPKAVREAAGINIGDKVIVEAREHEIIVRRPRLDELPWPEARRAAREDRLARRRDA